jgi:hypothetical protein
MDEEERITSSAGWEPKIELGCCCSCHDENKPHCDWCVHLHQGGKEE